MPQSFDRALDDVVQENFQKRKQERFQQRQMRPGLRQKQPYFSSRQYVGKFQQRAPIRQPRAALLQQRQMSGSSLQVSEQSDDRLTKILISNLEFGVTVEDIKELFSEFGRILRGVVNYDKSGRSLGTAEVTFGRKVEAIRALQHYNGVPLDGKPMSIEIVSSEVPRSIPMHSRVGSKNIVSQPKIVGNYEMPQADRPFPSHLAFQRQHNAYRPRMQVHDKRAPQQSTDSKTAEQLDRELDSYLVEQAKAKGM